MANDKNDPTELFEKLNLSEIKLHAFSWAEGPEGFEAIERIDMYRGWPGTGQDEYFLVVTTNQSSSDLALYMNWISESCLHIQKEIPRFYRGEPPKTYFLEWVWWDISPGPEFAAEDTRMCLYERGVTKLKPESELENVEIPLGKPDEYMFKLDENRCNIVFNGKERTVILLDSRLRLTGLKYIHHLFLLYVKNNYEPPEPISPFDFEVAVEGVHPNYIVNRRDGMATKLINKESDGTQNKTYDHSSQEEIRRLKEARQDILDKLTEAKDNNDLGRIEKAQDELNEFDDVISKEYSHLFNRATRQDPKDSQSGDQKERARKRVSDKINRTLSKIKEYDENLHDHLKTCLKKEKLGYTYKPPKKINWKI